MGRANANQRARLLFVALCSDRAVAPAIARCPNRTTFCENRGVRCARKNGRARPRSSCSTHFSRQCARGKARLSPCELGHPLVFVGRGDVLSLFPSGLLAVR
jgi:hypothetical protein